MVVHFSTELETKLARIAGEQGTDSEELVREAVERLVDHDEWFRDEVSLGLAQIDSGDTVSHRDVGERIGALLKSKQQPA